MVGQRFCFPPISRWALWEPVCEGRREGSFPWLLTLALADPACFLPLTASLSAKQNNTYETVVYLGSMQPLSPQSLSFKSIAEQGSSDESLNCVCAI